MDTQDNPVVLASNSLGFAMARREAGTQLRDATSKLCEAADTLRTLGLYQGAGQLDRIAESLRERFEIDEDGDALAYI